jgi:hypothetical protein
VATVDCNGRVAETVVINALAWAADPAEGLLVVHPPAALDAMVTQFHASVLAGEAV